MVTEIVTELATRSDVGAHSLPTPLKERPAASTGWARLRSALGTSAVVLLAVALVGAAVLVYVFHPRFDTVLSGSMRPGIQPGDVVMVRAVPNDDLRMGDVIAYMPPQQTVPVLHRIVDIDASGGIVTQGDANNVSDPWGRVRPEGDTTLRLVWVIPKVGLITHSRSTVIFGGVALLLAAIALVVFTHKRPEDTTDDDPANVTDGASDAAPGPYGDDVATTDTPPPHDDGDQSYSTTTALTPTTER